MVMVMVMVMMTAMMAMVVECCVVFGILRYGPVW